MHAAIRCGPGQAAAAPGAAQPDRRRLPRRQGPPEEEATSGHRALSPRDTGRAGRAIASLPAGRSSGASDGASRLPPARDPPTASPRPGEGGPGQRPALSPVATKPSSPLCRHLQPGLRSAAGPLRREREAGRAGLGGPRSRLRAGPAPSTFRRRVDGGAGGGARAQPFPSLLPPPPRPRADGARAPASGAAVPFPAAARGAACELTAGQAPRAPTAAGLGGAVGNASLRPCTNHPAGGGASAYSCQNSRPQLRKSGRPSNHDEDQPNPRQCQTTASHKVTAACKRARCARPPPDGRIPRVPTGFSRGWELGTLRCSR
ncbi:uncharacterized protein LOC141748029 [Larus michahellis]|uniref:uncharacterized protein LOC141748029 n=1 Tax=Larus michahellis TaxID=119627 RepID=UPI003D9B5B86